MARGLFLWLVSSTLFITLSTESPAAGDVSESQRLYDLNILHYNDLHSYFDETTPHSTISRNKDDRCVGGFARMYTTIKELYDENSLLLNAGDMFDGTPYYLLFKWKIVQRMINLLPNDACTLGNHDFRHGIEGLVPYMQHLLSPILLANMNSSAVPGLDDLYNKSVIIKKNGRRIGIIGVITSSAAHADLEMYCKTENKVENCSRIVTFSDELEAVQKEAERLTMEGVDIIIVLSHSGLDIDKKIARSVRYVDVVVGGHTHALLYNGAPPDNLTIDGEYPIVVNSDSGHKVLVVQSGSFGRFLGQLKLRFNQSGDVVSFNGNSVYLNSSIQQDDNILRILAPYKEEVEKFNKELIGTASVDLDHFNCTSGECLLGSFECDAFAELYAKSYENGGKHRPLCLLDAGHFAGPIYAGNITLSDLLAVHPFDDKVTTFELRGEFILEALELSVAEWLPDRHKSDHFMQVSGVHVVYNVSKPVGHRIDSIEVRCQDCDDGQFMHLDPNQNYDVVSITYLTSGGNGMVMISNNAKNLKMREVDIDALKSYLMTRGPVSQSLDGRIKVIH